MSSSHNSKIGLFFNSSSLRFCLAMIATATVALVTPLSAQQRTMNSTAERLPGTDVPASMQSTVQVMVELTTAPASVPYAAALKTAQAQADAQRNFALSHPNTKTSQAALASKQPVQISAAAASQVANTVKQIDQAQRSLLPTLTSAAIGGKVMYRVQRVYNGIAMVVSPSKISQIASMPGVKAVHPMHAKYPTAFTDIDFLGVRTAWAAASPFGGAHGENVKVGVIDSGLDYVHANFGGNADYTGVTDTNPNGHFPSFKVPGGYDFVGDAYNANDAVPVIAPDSNPWDGNPSGSSAGHGTACASLIGGYGENGDGTTYVLNTYNAVSPAIGGMKISPGMAPDCKLYPLRVFGNSGSTNFVTPAIEWALDPNGDGNFSDHLDVVSMSLGSNEGYADDDSAVASSNAAAAGVLVCAASGNAADTYYITSSPATANGILSVAATYNDQGGFIYNASVKPNTNAGAGSPPDGTYKAIYGSPSPQVPAGGLTGDVCYAVPNDGTPDQGNGPYTAYPNAASISGKICLVDRGTSGFVTKCGKAQASGAIAVIVDNFNNPTADPIPMGLTGPVPTVSIPCIMISRSDRDAIVAAAGGFDPVTGLPTNSPVNVTIRNDNGSVVHATTATDTMPQYSARGPRLGDSALKPDISAPAETVGVATNHTGHDVENFNGTSSATPHMAGIMALLRQLHPTWTVEELNALAINTATHDLTTGPSPVPAPTPVPSPGKQYGVGRVGAGRVDVAKASTANVVAYNQTNPGYISVSFGVVDVPAASSVTLSKTVKVSNKSGASVTYNITYQDVNATAGSSFTLPASITVGAGSTGTFNVGFTSTGSALRHEADTSITLTQPTSSGNVPRQYLSEKAGYAVLTPTSGPEPTIRVPLYAAPRPVATMHATISGVVPDAASGTFAVNLSGLSINTGSTFPTDIISLAKAFELQYASPLAGSPSAPTDPNVIKYVGVTSDWRNRTATERTNFVTEVTFAIDGFGDASVPEFNSSDREIFIDFDFDNVFDAAIFLSSRGNTSAQNFHTNTYRPIYVDIAGLFGSGPNAQFGLTGPTNALQPNVRDTNSFNNSAVIIPPTGAGLVGDPPFNAFQYQVVTFDRNGVEVDETPLLFFDAQNPGFNTIPAVPSASTVPSTGTRTLEPFMFTDLNTTTINADYNGANFQNAGSLGLLLVHMHNGSGNRSDVIAFRAPTIKSFSPTHGKVGAQITITGTNFGPGTQVTFFNNKPAIVVNVLTPNTLVATVPSGAISGPIRVSNAAGSSIKGGFTVDP